MTTLRDNLLRLFPDLRRLGLGAYVVGGAIRDLLRGVPPADVDVACPDPLDCARSLGRKVIRLGKEHLSAWRVVAEPHVYDFAGILDGDIGRDLARRDFTVNAMAIDLATGELLDPHGGRDDLANHVVRMVDARNFDDDPLRLLKAVRMAIALRFDIDGATVEAIRKRAPLVDSVAAERIAYELSIVLSSGAFRRALELLHATGLDVPILGHETDPGRFHADDIPLPAVYALVFPDPRAAAKRLRWSTSLVRTVTAIQALLSATGDLRVALYDAGETTARDFISALRAQGRDERIDLPDFSLRPLLTGDEIAALTGLSPGQELGRRKRALLEAQIRGEVKERSEAEALVRQSAGGAIGAAKESAGGATST